MRSPVWGIAKLKPECIVGPTDPPDDADQELIRTGFQRDGRVAATRDHEGCAFSRRPHRRRSRPRDSARTMNRGPADPLDDPPTERNPAPVSRASKPVAGRVRLQAMLLPSIILRLTVSQVLRTSSVNSAHSSIRLKIFLASSRYAVAVSRI